MHRRRLTVDLLNADRGTVGGGGSGEEVLIVSPTTIYFTADNDPGDFFFDGSVSDTFAGTLSGNVCNFTCLIVPATYPNDGMTTLHYDFTSIAPSGSTQVRLFFAFNMFNGATDGEVSVPPIPSGGTAADFSAPRALSGIVTFPTGYIVSYGTIEGTLIFQ